MPTVKSKKTDLHDSRVRFKLYNKLKNIYIILVKPMPATKA